MATHQKAWSTTSHQSISSTYTHFVTRQRRRATDHPKSGLFSSTGRLGTPCGGAQAKPTVGEPAAVCLSHTFHKLSGVGHLPRSHPVWQVRIGRLPHCVATGPDPGLVDSSRVHAFHMLCQVFFMLLCFLFVLIPLIAAL